MQVNGWELFAHPLLLDQLEKLIATVEKAKAKAKNPDDHKSTANFKLLAALYELMFVTVPADPARPEHRQGNALGDDYKHWFRAKFGGQRFRLFFRYHSRAKVIVYAWVNDEDSKRTYGSKTDAYAVFRKMLEKGNPPDDWQALSKAAKEPAAVARLKKARRPQAKEDPQPK
ncbi:type II toxin-antitoxin system YhaV family toxin [Candidatus Binatia bacterium]|nr:type II toxin-antitoxin system YhaV family toxin [Candidatus Binatia bacterium]